MDLITMTRNTILIVGWPLLVLGSVYLLTMVRGKKTYQMIKGSLLGKIITVFMYNMLIGMYALGAVATFYMFCDDEKAIYIVLPVFIIWGGGFIWTLKTLKAFEAETKKLTGEGSE
jgi:hypothetical protein